MRFVKIWLTALIYGRWLNFPKVHSLLKQFCVVPSTFQENNERFIKYHFVLSSTVLSKIESADKSKLLALSSAFRFMKISCVFLLCIVWNCQKCEIVKERHCQILQLAPFCFWLTVITLFQFWAASNWNLLKCITRMDQNVGHTKWINACDYNTRKKIKNERKHIDNNVENRESFLASFHSTINKKQVYQG